MTGDAPIARLGPAGYFQDRRCDPWADPRRGAALVVHLTRRHLAARYRGSAFGFLWSLLHPLLMMGVYTFVFQFVFRLSAPGVPYPAFFLTGLLAWSCFRTAAFNAATSVIDSAPLIHRAYFPRIVLPLSAVASNLVNFLVAVPLLVGFNLAFGIWPGASLAWLPVGLLLLTALATGVGLIAACLTPRFRDLLQILDVVFAAWFFATPVLYPASLAAENLASGVWRAYELNPMVGIVSLIRAAFLGQPALGEAAAVAAVLCVAILGLGIRLFQRLAPTFAEDC